MDLVLIETFLSIVQNRSITAASQQLFVSQSTVSSRLNQLENYLGTKLIERNRGISCISLTPYGQSFIPLAERWLQLNKETLSFSQGRHQLSLTIACPDSLNNYLFAPMYRELLLANPSIHLDIRTQQSPEIYDLVSNYEADLGFIFYQSRYANIISTPIFKEKMVLLCSSSGPWTRDSVHPTELDPQYEVHLTWSPDIQKWHDIWWKPSIRPYATVNAPSLVVHLMTHPFCWTLCPISMAKALSSDPNIRFLDLECDPPDRICYMLKRRSDPSSTSASIQIFQQYFSKFLAKTDWLV